MESITTAVTVLGAGPGGLAFVVDCMRRGIDALVYTHKDHQRTRNAAEKRGYVAVQGLMEGNAKINFTSEPQEAANFSKIFIMCLRGDVHADIWLEFQNVDLSSHLILFIPGSCAEQQLPSGIKFDGVFQATSTLWSATFIEETLYIGAKKASLTAARISKRYERTVEALLNIKVEWVINEFDVATQNASGVFHPPMMIGNAHRIKLGENFRLYADGLSQETIFMLSDIDTVRCNIREALGFSKVSTIDTVNKLYATNFKDIEHFRDQSALHAMLPAPKTLKNRMLIEDVRVHWVLWYELAELLGLDTTPLRQGIERAGELVGDNFFETGITLKKLSLGDISRETFIGKYGA
ncbi:6-phosphogluconate dehydrogenase [Trichoderma evansii]